MLCSDANISYQSAIDINKNVCIFMDNLPCKVLEVKNVNKSNKYSTKILVIGMDIFTHTKHRNGFRKHEQVLTFHLIKKQYHIIDITKSEFGKMSFHCKDENAIKIITTSFYDSDIIKDIKQGIGIFVYVPMIENVVCLESFTKNT